MAKPYFQSLEKQSHGFAVNLDEFLANLVFNEVGLIPAIAQQHDSGEVLMLAWMNADSIRLTLQKQQVVYWSRSRQKLWHKGEESGHFQHLISVHTDCDGDCLLLKVNQIGKACHTGRRHCFYWQLHGADNTVTIQA